MPRTLEGGKIHEKMMLLAADYLKQKGYEVVFRARLNNHGVVDVLGIKGKEHVGIECQIVPGWKVLTSKIRRYSSLSKLILAIPKNVKPRLSPEGLEIIKLDVERPKPLWTVIQVLPEDHKRLTQLKGELTSKQGKVVYYQDVVKFLLDEHEKKAI